MKKRLVARTSTAMLCARRIDRDPTIHQEGTRARPSEYIKQDRLAAMRHVIENQTVYQPLISLYK